MAGRAKKGSSTAGPGVHARTTPGDTRSAILDVAERLVQVRGFNAFSYADVAAELGITKAGLHHHFPSKADLGAALVARYSTRFGQALDEIDSADAEAAAKLTSYVGLYAEVLRDGRMCLCGMLAAEHETLAPSLRDAVVAFLTDNERWLARVLEAGRLDGSLDFDGSASDVAASIVGGLEGAMLVARSYGQVDRFQRSAERLLTAFAGASR